MYRPGDVCEHHGVGDVVVVCGEAKAFYGVDDFALVRSRAPRGVELQLGWGDDERLHGPGMVDLGPHDAAYLTEVKLSMGAVEARALKRCEYDGQVPHDLQEKVANGSQSLPSAKRFAYSCGGRHDHPPVGGYDGDSWFPE